MTGYGWLARRLSGVACRYMSIILQTKIKHIQGTLEWVSPRFPFCFVSHSSKEALHNLYLCRSQMGNRKSRPSSDIVVRSFTFLPRLRNMIWAVCEGIFTDCHSSSHNYPIEIAIDFLQVHRSFFRGQSLAAMMGALIWCGIGSFPQDCRSVGSVGPRVSSAGVKVHVNSFPCSLLCCCRWFGPINRLSNRSSNMQGKRTYESGRTICMPDQVRSWRKLKADYVIIIGGPNGTYINVFYVVWSLGECRRVFAVLILFNSLAFYWVRCLIFTICSIMC